MSVLETVEEYFNEKPSPFLNAKTVQIVMIRQLMDFTILRTEDSKELNIVELPKSLDDPVAEVYGLFLASKQKAPESRQFAEFLRKYNNEYDCFLPKNLCMECPRCLLFGSVKTGGKYNIKHRVEYSSAYSLLPFRDISETITFNAVSEADQKVGQALNVTHNFKPLTVFPSIITLKSVTTREFTLFVKTLLSTHSYGAESRVKGDVRNEIIAFVFGLEEIITPLELNLDLKSVLDGSKNISRKEMLDETAKILQKYRNLAGSPEKVKILTSEEVEKLLTEIRSESPEKIAKKLDEEVKAFLADVQQSN
ncbi:MAG: type I-D CRISPR-associated protein Cas7/Csc2 [Candidatus Odinarchaeota archaeon]